MNTSKRVVDEKSDMAVRVTLTKKVVNGIEFLSSLYYSSQ